MITLPLPLIASLLLVLWLVRAALEQNRSRLLLAAVAVAAAQGALTAAVQHYGLTVLRPAQPIGATLVPAALWLAFDAQTAGARPAVDRTWRVWAPHMAAPLLALLSLAAAPAWLDVLVPVSFAAYGGAILWATRPGGRILPDAALEHGDAPRLLWRVVAAALCASALGDALIAVDFAVAGGARQGALISIFSALTILALGVAALSDVLAQPNEAAAPGDAAGPGDAQASKPARADALDAPRLAAVFDRVDAAMRAKKHYLDPDLTLGVLARRIGCPAKEISAAVNQRTGENVSRYVNGHRIAQARGALSAGASVTEAMLESGFNTKSNFNREFSRVVGETPSAFRRRASAEAGTAEPESP